MRFLQSKFLKDKLGSYQKDQLGDKEKQIIDHWFAEQQQAAGDRIPKNQEDITQLHNELLHRVMAETAFKQTKLFKLPYRWIGIASLFAIILSLAYLYSTKNQYYQRQRPALVFQTANGTTKKITLQDGTVIWMNAGTLIRIDPRFSQATERKIYLDKGEAFFQVKRDTRRPFRIATGKMLTTVLGTSFNIKAYPETHTYQVAVSTGKVMVARRNYKQWQVLNNGIIKGEVLSHDLLTKKTAVNKGDISQISNWKTNRNIYADGLNITEIAAAISRQYDVNVRLAAGADTSKRYDLTLPYKDLKTALQQLAAATGITYQLNSTELIIIPPTL